MKDAVPASLLSNSDAENLEDCLAICLSGGGYRAMLFHLGTLWYLSDAGILAEAGRISSVSGGSITSALLGLRWNAIAFGTPGHPTRFRSLVVDPIRKLASKTIDVRAVLLGALLPGTISDRVRKAYDETLYQGATLQDLPDAPRFVINATNVQTGALFRFSKPYIRDYRVGMIRNPRRLLAEAVTASSAFPPVLSPVRLEFGDDEWEANSGEAALQKPPYTTEVRLTDGGVYDNMGIETAWKRCKTILVSDAGAKMQPDPDPHGDAARHSLRVNSLIDNQVRSLRKRQVVSAYQAKVRDGAYWGMWTSPDEYTAPSQLVLSNEKARELAEVSTRLAKMDGALQERLINFGYGMAERAVRTYWRADALAAPAFPYPRGI
ncbi:MAG: patatin-like phospholipase family protein [Acidobacteria bacterium]|nr:patatin-like phospholipase family protein [Acidobacteriota bacterium]